MGGQRGENRGRLSGKPEPRPGLKGVNPGGAALPSPGLDVEPGGCEHSGQPTLTCRASLILALQSTASPFPGSPLEPYKTNEVSAQGLGRQGPAARCLSNRTAADTGCVRLSTGGSRAAIGGAYRGTPNALRGHPGAGLRENAELD